VLYKKWRTALRNRFSGRGFAKYWQQKASNKVEAFSPERCCYATGGLMIQMDSSEHQ
jgi:hypothetical protein